VAIAANTTYVVSYHITNGRYAVDPGYFAASGVTNYPLRALAHNEEGPNGVYVQSSSSAFPIAGNGANYWVDVDVVVAKAAVAIASGLAADNKVYDGTTVATLRTNGAVILSGVIAGDAVELVTNGYVAVFTAADVGADLPVGVSGLGLGGPDAWKYALVQPTNLTANITPATVTPSVTVAGKSYDGSTAATIAGRSLSGIIGSDDVNLGASGSAAFADKNVGVGKTVNITDLGLSGTEASNYVLAAATTSTTADITARALVVGAAGSNKVYDGTTSATVTLSDNRVAGDLVTASYTTAHFNDKNVGRARR